MSIETIKKFGPFYLNENTTKIYSQAESTDITPDTCLFYSDIASKYSDLEIIKNLIDLKKYYVNKSPEIEVEYYIDLHVDFGFTLKASVTEPFIHNIWYILLNIPANIINLLYESNELKTFGMINKAANIADVFNNISDEIKIAAKLK